MFVFMADVQALTDNADNPGEDSDRISLRWALDYLSADLTHRSVMLVYKSDSRVGRIDHLPDESCQC